MTTITTSNTCEMLERFLTVQRSFAMERQLQRTCWKWCIVERSVNNLGLGLVVCGDFGDVTCDLIVCGWSHNVWSHNV